MKIWLLQHRQALLGALRRLAQAPVSALLGALVIGIALALPAFGELVLWNLGQLQGGFTAQPQISLFLAQDADKRDAAAVQAKLRQVPGIREFRYVPREETLRRMRQAEGLTEVIDALPRNPFPDAFVVDPADDAPASLEKLRAEFSAWSKVEHVQLDSAWVKRLHALLHLGRATVLLLAGLLGLALVVVTFNTIRLQILTQRAEIEVSRLLGATDGYIRRPFFYFGALQGLAGGAVAWLIVLAGAHLVRDPVSAFAALYDLGFSLRMLPAGESLLLLGFAGMLGLMGAWLSVARHLRGPEAG